MATKIVTKNSSTASAVPTASDLVQGELAVNVADKRLFTEDNAGAIVELGTNPSTIDINAGTIDGTTVGASSASTGAFTTLTATGIDVTGTATMDGLVVNAGTNKVVLANNFATTGNTDSPKLAFYSFGDVATYPVSGPSIKKVNTGSYGAGDLVIYQHGPTDFTNEVEALRIDSSGNVGIGVAPAFPFHVQASDGALAQFSNGVDADCTIRTASGVTLITPSTGTLALGTSSTERMRIDSSGNVGIGTSSPSRALATKSSSVTVANFESTSATAGFISFSDSNTTNDVTVRAGAVGDNLVLQAGGSERMRIDSNGNVGIGTASPSVPLTVKANSGGNSLRLLGRSADGFAFLGFRNSADSVNNGEIGISDSKHMLFYTNDAERMRIDSSGNLLVGTTSQFSIGRVCSLAADGVASFETKPSADISYNAVMFLNSANSQVGRILCTSSATSYVTSSDQRLKDNIADADDAGSKIDAIRVRQYDWKADGSHQDYGMVAQELQLVAPEAVSGDAESEEMMGVDYSKLVPMLIKEIQSLRNRVAQLEE